MLEYATKLTGQPGQVGEEDVRRMRLGGFSDEEVLQVNLITSYFNFVNRIVSGLGVPLEDAEERVYRY
jgi:alkylhydroperoxidase family enzyme